MALPLTKRKQDGSQYVRLPVIEAAIDMALIQDLPTLRRRAEILDRQSPDFLASECLVHLIRFARRRNDEQTMNALLPMLLVRCEAILAKKVANTLPNAPTLREDILAQFAELFAAETAEQDNHELDFFEVRFNFAFRTFRIDRVRAELAHLKTYVALPNEASELSAGGGAGNEGEVLAPLTEIYGTINSPDEIFSQKDLKKRLYAAINDLPPDERKAVVLCHMLGFKEESEDPAKTTAATLCGVTGRTIRNRLTRAESKLSQFKEDV